MKLLIFYFCLLTCLLPAQQIKSRSLTDTLLVFGNKYPLVKTNGYLSSVLDFPFAIFKTQYQTNRKIYDYKAIKVEDCVATFGEFDDLGNEIQQLFCIGKEKITYSLTNFTDSVLVDIKNFSYSDIRIKSGAKWININRIRYQAVYDSTLLTIYLDASSPDKTSLGKIMGSDKEPPRFLILDLLFYVDEKLDAYYLPCEFLIRPKK